MKFGVTFLQKSENNPCRRILSCEKCRKAFFFFIHSASSRRRCTHHHHTTIQLHSSYLLSLQLDALQPVRSPAVRPAGVSPPGVSTFPSGGFFCVPNSPEDTAGVTDIHVLPTSHFHHTAVERRPPSLTWIQFSVKSNSASPLNPMRQKAETEAETHWWRSSCTLDRRHGCCGCHNVFTHKLIM